MSLLSTYSCAESGASLVISSDNGNGQASGTFSIGNFSTPVTIHYHYENSSGPVTTINMIGAKDDPNQYVGGAGSASNTTASEGIQLAGGLATIGNVVAFSGLFTK